VAGSVSHMSISGDEESRRLREVMIQNTEDIEALRINNREHAEMIEEANKTDTELQAELSELKNNNVSKSTLLATHHIILDKIKRIISVEWPHLMSSHEDVELVIMVNREVDIITKEIDDKPFKCQQLIIWLKSKSPTELLQNGLRDRTIMIMQANSVVAKYRLTEAARYQGAEMTNKVVAFKYTFKKVIQRGLPFIFGSKQ